MNKNILIIAAELLLIIVVIVLSRSCNPPVDQPVLDYNALKFSKDSLQTVNNAIVMDYAAFKKVSVAKEDSLTKLLQAHVSKNTISIAAISTKISSQDSGKTNITVNNKPVSKDSLPCDPTFSYDKVDTTEMVHVRANKDSTHISFMLFNKQIIESRYQNNGFLGLGKKSIVLEVTNSNPKIRTIDQRSFVAPAPKANRLLWFAGGIVLSSATYIYLRK